MKMSSDSMSYKVTYNTVTVLSLRGLRWLWKYHLNDFRLFAIFQSFKKSTLLVTLIELLCFFGYFTYRIGTCCVRMVALINQAGVDLNQIPRPG